MLMLISSAASAEEWKLADRNKNIHINESLLAGDYTITLSDVAKNSDGDVTACMFTVYENKTKVESTISERGAPAEILDGRYRVTLLSGNKNKIYCSCDYLVRPLFICSSTTVRDNSGYNKTVFKAKVVNTEAKSVKIKYVIKGLNLKSSKPSQKSYNTLKENENITENTIRWKGNGTITIKITYKDAEGNEYSQTYDVIKNTTTEKIEAVKSTTTPEKKNIITSKVNAGRVSAEKKVFKKAIERALKYIDFSEESEKDLQRILTEL